MDKLQHMNTLTMDTLLQYSAHDQHRVNNLPYIKDLQNITVPPASVLQICRTNQPDCKPLSLISENNSTATNTTAVVIITITTMVHGCNLELMLSAKVRAGTLSSL